MSDIAWFKNEVELVSDFLKETAVLLASVESYDAKLILLVEKKTALENEIVQNVATETLLEVVSDTIEQMEKKIKEKLHELQMIKQNYMAEELIDTLETLSSAEEGEILSEEVCNVIKAMNLLMRKYNMSYIG